MEKQVDALPDAWIVNRSSSSRALLAHGGKLQAKPCATSALENSHGMESTKRSCGPGRVIL